MPTLQLVIDARRAAEGAAQFNAATQQVQQSAGYASKAVEGLDRQFGGLGPTTQSVVGYLKGLVATYGTLLSVQHVYQVISGFENALDRVSKMTGATGPALERLGDRFVAMSTKIPVSAQELANLGATAAQLGVRGSEDILKFTETAARLSDALGVGAEAAVTALARVAQATGEGYAHVEKLGAVMGRLGMSTAAAGEQILGMAEGIARSASLYKMSSADVLGLAAAFASAGAGAEQGAMTVNKLLREMDQAVREGGPKLQLLARLAGQTGQEFAAGFEQNAADALSRFVAGLGQVIAAGGDASAVLEALGLDSDRVGKSLPVLAANADLLARSLALARKEAAMGTALEDDFGKLDDRLNALRNTVDAVILKFRGSKGAAADFLGTLREAIAIVGGLEPVTRDTSDAALALAQGFKVAGAVLAGIATIKIGSFFVGLTQDLVAATKAMAGFAASCWPVAVALTALGGIEIGRYLYDEFASVRSGAQDVVKALQTGAEQIRYAWELSGWAIQSAWQLVVEALAKAFAWMVGKVADGMGVLEELAQRLGADLGDSSNRLKAWADSFGDSISQAIQPEKLRAWVQELQGLGAAGGEAFGRELQTAIAKAMTMSAAVAGDLERFKGQLTPGATEKMIAGMRKTNQELIAAIDAALSRETDAQRMQVLSQYRGQAVAMSALRAPAGVTLAGVREQHASNLRTIEQTDQWVRRDIAAELPTGRQGQGLGQYVLKDLEQLGAKIAQTAQAWSGLGTAAQAAGEVAGQGMQQADHGTGQLRDGVKLTAEEVRKLAEAAQSASRLTAEEIAKRNHDVEQMIRSVRMQRDLLTLTPEQREIQIGIDQMQLRMVDEAGRKIEGVTDRTEEFRRELQMLQDAKKLEETAQGIGDAFGNAFESILVDCRSVSEALQNLAKDIQRVLVRQLVTQPIASAITSSITGAFMPAVTGGGGGANNMGGGTGPSVDFAGEMARGGVISAGELLPFRRGGVLANWDVVPFRRGGVVNRPTLFSLARNRIGLMGEEGPEAILPLQRLPDGQLGVRAAVQPFAAGGVLPQSAFFPLSGDRMGLAGEEGPEAILPLKRGSDGKLGVAAQVEGKGGVTLVQHITINTPDVGSFRKSKHQVAAELQAMGIRAMRRG